MLNLIYDLLLVSFPAILAGILHMVVVKYNWFSFLCFPLDHNKTYRGHRIFGANKSYRGVIAITLLSIISMVIYQFGLLRFPSISSHNLLWINNLSWLWYGLLYGLGYVIGELPNSFIKRQRNIAPGKANGFLSKLIDQLDSVLSLLFLLVLFSDFSLTHFLVGIVFFSFLHAFINLSLFSVGLRKEPF